MGVFARHNAFVFSHLGASVLAALLPALAGHAAVTATLQGHSSNSVDWTSTPLSGWHELDSIPCRLLLSGGPATNRAFTLDFDHLKGVCPGIESLGSWTTSSNVVLSRAPACLVSGTAEIGSCPLSFDLRDANPGWIEFRVRLSAGAHCATTDSFGLRCQPSPCEVRIVKPPVSPGSPDLSLTKSGPASADPGQVIAYSIHWTNKYLTCSHALTIQVSDTLPAWVQYVDQSASPPAALVGDTLVWDLGSVTRGVTGTITYRVQVRTNAVAGQSFTNYAQIRGAQNDVNPGNNVASVVTRVNSHFTAVANDDSYTVPENVVLKVAAPGVLLNDSNRTTKPLVASLAASPSHGSVVLSANGSFVYTPKSNFFGADSFTYVASNCKAESGQATVHIWVERINHAPVAANDAYSVNEDTVLNVAAPGVLANDTDLDGDVLAALLVSGPTHGRLTLSTNGSFVYTSATNYNGSDSFTYKAGDGATNSGVATVTITVRAVNDAPVANPDSYTLNEGGVLTIPGPGVLANDTDVDGDTLHAVLVTGPAHGTLVLNPDGSFTYTPAPGYNGSDSFSYKANDGTTDSGVVTVTLTVRAINHAPVAVNDAFSVNEDTVLNVAAPGVLGNDTDVDGNALTALLVTSPAHGTVTLSTNGSLVYRPMTNYNGSDSFTYKAGDGATNSGVATVTITVRAVNDAPVANPDSYTVNEDGVLTIPGPGVLANDTDVDGDPLHAVLVTGPTHGTLVLNPDGSFTYTPTPGYNGSDAFSYKANDGTTDSGVVTVTFTVRAINHAPVAVNDTFSVNEDTVLNVAAPGVLGNDTDVDGNALTALLVTSPAHGTVTLSTNGSLVYRPMTNYNGSDSFTYKAGDGATNSGVATVTITVRAVNDAPVANPDSYTVNEDGVLTIPGPGVLANDTDVDGDTLHAVLVTGPAHGTLVLNPDGSFTYTPAPGYNGSDSFSYKANDGTTDSGVVTVTLTVRAINHAPVAVNDAYSVNEDTVLNVAAPGVLGNDTDVDGNALIALLVSNPAHGTVALSTNGSLIYTPATNYNGSDSFTYKAGDGTTNSAVATVTITVRAVNDAPVANPDSYAVNEDGVLTVAGPGVLANDTDVDGDTLHAVLVTGPAHGTLVLNPDGSFTYTPAPNFNGTDSFTYRANDGTANSGVSTVTLRVAAVNDAPVAVDDTYSVDEDIVLNVTAPGVLANDTDVDGDPLTAVLVAAPAHGVLTLNANGGFVYIPATNYNGSDQFSYRANDGTTNSAIAVVRITIRAVNDAPVANADSFSIGEDTALNVAAPGVLANDTDVEGNALTAILVTSPAHGTVTFNANGSFVYVPAANYNGVDTFTYKANDGSLDSLPATVTLTVFPINDPPSFTKGPNQLVNAGAGTQRVAGWARDVSPGPADEAAQHVTFHVASSRPDLFLAGPTLAADGTLIFTPASGVYGDASVTVSAQDDGGTANGGIDQSAPVTFTITVNAPPLVSLLSPTNGAIYMEPAGVFVVADAVDLDGTVTNVSLFQGTQLILSTNQAPYFRTLTKLPAGNYTFTAVATDNRGASATSAPVSISVVGVESLMAGDDIHLDLQTGLFIQHLRFTNSTTETLPGVRVSLRNLATNVTVWNASGSVDGVPFVQADKRLLPGQAIQFSIEYYIPDRVIPNPQFSLEVAHVPMPLLQPVGTLVPVTRQVPLADGTLLIEWESITNRIYYVLYGDSSGNWKTAMPAVVGTGTRMQWVDNGLPKTICPPADAGVRFYHVMLTP